MSGRRLLALLVFALFASCGGYLLLWPVAIDPEPWDPPVALKWKANAGLAGAEWLHRELGGPEAVTFDAANRAVVGLADGRVVRFASDGSGAVEELARTGGRPLGVKYDAAGRLVIADAFKGLLALGADGKLVTLATSAGGVAFGTTDDLAIAQDGTIYFTDATTRWPVNQFALDILEHRPSGRLLAYHPDTGKTEIVLAGLYFANGVAFGPDEAYVVVTETASYRVQRVWLRGERAGQVDTFADNLPGFPDNITWSPTRRAFWVAIGSPRNRLLDKVAGRPWLRKVIARLPRALQPAPERHAWALALGEDGKVVADLQYVAKDSYSPVASVIEHDGWLYLGSFIRDGVARVKAP